MKSLLGFIAVVGATDSFYQNNRIIVKITSGRSIEIFKKTSNRPESFATFLGFNARFFPDRRHLDQFLNDIADGVYSFNVAGDHSEAAKHVVGRNSTDMYPDLPTYFCKLKDGEGGQYMDQEVGKKISLEDAEKRCAAIYDFLKSIPILSLLILEHDRRKVNDNKVSMSYKYASIDIDSDGKIRLLLDKQKASSDVVIVLEGSETDDVDNMADAIEYELRLIYDAILLFDPVKGNSTMDTYVTADRDDKRADGTGDISLDKPSIHFKCVSQGRTINKFEINIKGSGEAQEAARKHCQSVYQLVMSAKSLRKAVLGLDH